MRGRPPDRPGPPPPPGGGRGRRGDEPDWRSLLGTGTARQILVRLASGDPLGIAERCRTYVLTHALLLEPARLAGKTIARAAYVAAAHGYHGTPVLDMWLAKRMTEAVEELRIDDTEREMAGLPPADADRPFFLKVAQLLEIEHGLARRLCLVFQQMPLAARLPFFRVAVEGRSFEDAAESLDLPIDVVRATVEQTYRRIVRLARQLDDDLGRGLP